MIHLNSASSKTLAMFLSISMVLGTAAETPAFAAGVKNVGDTFDAEAYTFTVTDSGTPTVELTSVKIIPMGGQYVIPGEVNSDGTDYKVGTIKADAFKDAKAVGITTTTGAGMTGQLVAKAQTYKDGADVSATENGGYIGLSKDNSMGYTLLQIANTADGYSFAGWYNTSGGLICNDPTMPNVVIGSFYARFSKGVTPRDLDVNAGNNWGYTLSAGETCRLRLHDENGIPVTGSLVWSVAKNKAGNTLSNPADAVTITDTANGVVLASKEEGRAVLQATDANGKAYYVRVTVQTSPENAISLDSPTDLIYLDGDGKDFGNFTTVSVLMPGGAAAPGDLTVTSSDPNVAAVTKGASENKFTVKPVKAGTVTITAAAHGYAPDSAPIQVRNQKLMIFNNSQAIAVNGTAQLHRGRDGASTPTSVTWKSGDESIATVDGNGKVTGVKPGIAIITVSAAGFAPATATVVVRPADESQVSYSYDGKNYYKADFFPAYASGTPSAPTNVVYRNPKYADPAKGLDQPNLLGGTLYVKVPCAPSDAHFSAWLESSHRTDPLCERRDSCAVSAAASDAASTTLQISLPADAASCQGLDVSADLKGLSVGWAFDLGGTGGTVPKFGRDGTYTCGSKTFSFTDDGKFYWGASKQPVQFGYTVDYGFSYGQGVYFYVVNGQVQGIEAQILSTASPTEAWVGDLSLDDDDLVQDHAWEWKDGSSVPEFIDRENLDGNGNPEAYTLNGSSPTQPSGPTGGGTSGGAPVTPIIAPAPQSTGLGTAFRSDTTASLSVSDGYTIKITSLDGKAPTIVVGTAGVFEVTLVKQDGNDYYFKITAIGAPGQGAGIYVDGGSRLLIATVGQNSNFAACDTTCPFDVESGKSYVFKITAKKKPDFEAGTPGVFRLEFLRQDGDNYYYRITATGKPGQGCGFYLNGSQQPVSVATIR